MFCWNGRADHGTTCVSKGQRLCSAVLLWFLLCQSQNLSRNKGQDLNLGKNVTWSLLKIFFLIVKSRLTPYTAFLAVPSLDVRFGYHHPVPSRSRWASVRAQLWRGHTLSSALGASPKKKKEVEALQRVQRKAAGLWGVCSTSPRRSREADERTGIVELRGKEAWGLLLSMVISEEALARPGSISSPRW